ncbi:MAG: hypothetical protein ACXV8P_00270 [Methylobacter sp.]
MYIKAIMLSCLLTSVSWGVETTTRDHQDQPKGVKAQVKGPATEQEKEAAKQEALRRFMNQGNGTIRKPGTSGFRSFNRKNMF